MTYSNLLFDVDAGVATITFNRPDKRNAMSDDMRSEFIDALERVSADTAIRALVLTGAGKGFCAGGDIAGMERRMQAPGRRSRHQRLASAAACASHAVAAAYVARSRPSPR